MATNHQVWVAYVDSFTPQGDPILATRRVMADNLMPLEDIRDVIQIRFRRCINGQHFEDKYSGWPCFKLDMGKGPNSSDYTNVLRCQPKDGGTPAAAQQISYHHPDFAVNENPSHKALNAKIVEVSMGGSGARLYSYDVDAANFQDVLDVADTLTSTDTPLTT